MIDILEDDEKLNNLIYSIDYKVPSSEKEEDMITENIPFLVDGDVLRFHVQSTEDLNYMKSVIDDNEPQASIFVIPINNYDPKNIVDFINLNNIQKVRVQLSLRKAIYG